MTEHIFRFRKGADSWFTVTTSLPPDEVLWLASHAFEQWEIWSTRWIDSRRESCGSFAPGERTKRKGKRMLVGG
jgi:hypothetical protein